MRRLESCWQSPARFLLLPFGLIFGLLAHVRRMLYRYGLLESIRPPVPVLIVGNITAGGSGKTPLVAALAEALAVRGLHPGVVSRGYGGSAAAPLKVDKTGDPGIFGDEPLLLASKGFPVWVGKKRGDAALGLLASDPQCDILIGDDGLQHYALCRDFEIAVIDGERVFGNGRLLPAGPLRELPSRLDSVDAIVVNCAGKPLQLHTSAPVFSMHLSGNVFISVDHPEISASEFPGKKLHAIAGIGNPQRFFDHLAALGLRFTPHPFPDHHPYRSEDLEFEDCDIIIMTEKDAIKCRGLAPGKSWFLPVKAEIDSALVELILKTLGK